jgi:hypothetical protein
MPGGSGLVRGTLLATEVSLARLATLAPGATGPSTAGEVRPETGSVASPPGAIAHHSRRPLGGSAAARRDGGGHDCEVVAHPAPHTTSHDARTTTR